MPELPEVETTRRGIEPHIQQQEVVQVIVRQPSLRWPVLPEITQLLVGEEIQQVKRRGKYLLLKTSCGTAIIHLGMSGSLRILEKQIPAGKHDHIDIIFDHNICLRFNDPRRFGCFLWTSDDPSQHELLKHLGPEPLTSAFDGDHLYTLSRGRTTSVKTFIMDSQVVVGVGNIYANEALFYAGIHPEQPAKNINAARYHILAEKIRAVLEYAIDIGGTTIRNFAGSDGKPGYFVQKLKVYGRGGLKCYRCNGVLEEVRLGQRTTVFCGECQV